MKVVHLGTVIQTTFGELDDDGNVIREFAISGENNQPIQVRKLSAEAFTELYQLIANAKKQIEDSYKEKAVPKISYDDREAE